MTDIAILGAGMAGLLAGNMLRRHKLRIIEAQRELPNNHHAVLRFRDKGVSDQLHIPFREVRVFKSCDEADPVKAMLRYSKKVVGRYEPRSLINLEPSTRYIAPPDLVQRMADGLPIIFNAPVESFGDLPPDHAIISTIPMMMLMDLLKYPGPRPLFKSEPGWSVTANVIGCDAFVTRYVTDPDKPFYRISLTGNKLIVEGTGAGEREECLAVARMAGHHIGIDPQCVEQVSFHPARYAKLAELSGEARQMADDFMLWATLEHNVYSLGRFATWRRGLLLDHLVKDILKIERWMQSSRFNVRKSI